MTADAVEQLVMQEIGGDWDRWTSHALDLRRCIVRPPTREIVRLHRPGGDDEFRLWRVIEEDPDTLAGYVVLYDDQTSVFGLGVRGQGGRITHVGDHGDLWTTLEGM